MKLIQAFACLVFWMVTLPGLAGQTNAPPPTWPAEHRSSRDQLLTPPQQQRLKIFRTMFVESDTVYLEIGVLQKALSNRFDMRAWKIELAAADAADVWVKVWRPTFTFDWHYEMKDPDTNLVLAAGRIVAWDGNRAAEGIAADIARNIGRVRRLPTHLLAAFKDPAGARKWELKYHDGSEGPRQGAKLLVSVTPERIVARRDGRIVFVIPTQAISGVAYNARISDRARGWEAFWDGAGNVSNSDDAFGALMLLGVALAGDVMLKQFKVTEHFCDLAWLDSGTVRNVAFKANNGKTAQEFVAGVEQVSHRKAIDMQAEGAALAQAIKREDAAGRFVPLRLDKKTAVGWKMLEPGEYRVVVVERIPGRAVAYFLPTHVVAPDRVAAQMPVTIEPAASKPTSPSVSYRDAEGIAALDAIATADKTLRFRAIPLAFASEPQVSEDMEELLAQAALKPSYRSIRVKSDTVYLKREVMERALAQHPAMVDWEIRVLPAERERQAELALVVSRPFLTFDWKYIVTEVTTGNKLLDAQITARDGDRAAALIADEIVNALKAWAAQQIRGELE